RSHSAALRRHCGAKSGVHTDAGYHSDGAAPCYWDYARNSVLQDHLFEPVKSWSLPEHLCLVSGWSARCKNRSPMSCVNDIAGPYTIDTFGKAVHSELTTGQ